MLEINNLILVNTLLSLLFIFGLLGIADSSSSFFIKRYKKINQIFFFNLICFFVIIVIGLASLIQIVYLFQIPKHKFFYSLFLFIVFFGIYFIFKKKNFILENKLSFDIKIYVNFLIILFFILSISPPTDIDSADYHLGAPLKWFNEDVYAPDYTWLHYRFAGLGENINLIGIYFKTYNFGQIFQFLGLLFALYFGKFFLKREDEKNFFSLFILSSPALISLVSTQKFQLLPSSLMFCSFLILFYIKKITNFKILFIMSSILFSIGCKISYVFPGLSIVVVLLVKTFYQKKILNLFFITFILFTIILAPLYFRNFIYYGDPISPILEKFKINSDQSLINFLNYNKTFARNFENNLQFIKYIFFPVSFAKFTESLGLLPLTLLFINFKKINKTSLRLLFFSCLVCLIIFFSYRGLGRYYLEFYFTIAFIVAKNYQHLYFKRFIKFFLIITSILVLIPLLYSFFSLSYGVINKNYWEHVMNRKAFGYSAAKWVNNNLNETSKKEKILLSGVRFYSFYRNKFVSHQYYEFDNLKKTSDLIIKEKINYIFYLEDSFSANYFEKCIEYTDKKVGVFENSFRNPFNQSDDKMIGYLIRIKKINC
jgi:hypothetical protein